MYNVHTFFFANLEIILILSIHVLQTHYKLLINPEHHYLYREHKVLFELSQTLSCLLTSREQLMIKNLTTSGSHSLFPAAKCKIVLPSYKII